MHDNRLTEKPAAAPRALTPGRTSPFTPASNIISWILGLTILAIGMANLVLVHPVPGLAFILVSVLIMPPLNVFLQRRFGYAIPYAVRVMLGIAAIWFTLGVSDLGDMID